MKGTRVWRTLVVSLFMIQFQNSNAPIYPKRTRSAKEIVDQAIAENRPGEWILYSFSCAFAAVSLVVLVVSVVRGESMIAVSSAVSSYLFWPVMRCAQRIRKENMALRLLEVTLSRPDTSKEAADMIGVLFKNLLADRQKDGPKGV